MAGFFFDSKHIEAPKVANTGEISRAILAVNPFKDLKGLWGEYLQNQHNIGVAEAKNELLNADSYDSAINIMNHLRAKGLTETQLEEAGAQNILDKRSEQDFRKTQEESMKLQNAATKEQQAYLAQTREADRLMAFLKEQALLQKDSAKLGMATVWNRDVIQKALASNAQFKDRATEYYKANDFLTNLKDVADNSNFSDLNLRAAQLQTELQRNVSEQELLQSELGLAPDWATNPKYKDKAVLLDSLTNGMDVKDTIETKEQFEKKLRDISARLPDLPMEAKLSIVASGLNKNTWFWDLFGGSSVDFSNADSTIKRLEDLSRRVDRKGQSLLNQILDYSINNQPAINESKDVLTKKTLQVLRDSRDTLIRSIETNPIYTKEEKDKLIYNAKYQAESMLPTILRNTLDAAENSKNLKIGDINRKKRLKEIEEYIKETKARKEQNLDTMKRFNDMVENSGIL